MDQYCGQSYRVLLIVVTNGRLQLLSIWGCGPGPSPDNPPDTHTDTHTHKHTHTHTHTHTLSHTHITRHQLHNTEGQCTPYPLTHTYIANKTSAPEYG